MKTWCRLIFAAVVISLGFAGQSYAGEHYHVFILAGQSNMDGRGKVADLDADWKKPQDDVRFYYGSNASTSGGWIPLQPGYSVPPNYKGELPSPTFGPELSFGRAMAAAMKGKKVALIKYAVGGTNLNKQWDPQAPGPQYANFLKTLKASLAALKKEGATYEVDGMVWHQGESDASLSAEDYQKKLEAFIQAVRAELKAPELPFVIGELFNNGQEGITRIRTAQEAAAKATPHTAFVSSAHLTVLDKITHFDAASQLQFGQRYADAMKSLMGGYPTTGPSTSNR